MKNGLSQKGVEILWAVFFHFLQNQTNFLKL